MKPRAEKAGFAMIVVLTLAVALGAVVSASLRASLSAARDAGFFVEQNQADSIARAAPDLLAAYVGAMAAGRRAGAFEARFAHARLRVTYANAAGRVDVNAAPPALIGALLAAAGASAAEAQAAVERLSRERSGAAQDQGAGQTGTGQIGPGYQKQLQNTPILRHPDELAALLALPPALAARLRPALTIASGSASVDPSLASPLVVSALFGAAADRRDDFLRQRDNGFPTAQGALALLPAEARGLASFDLAPAVEAQAVVTLDSGLRRGYQFTLSLGREGEASGQPLRVNAFRPLFAEAE